MNTSKTNNLSEAAQTAFDEWATEVRRIHDDTVKSIFEADGVTLKPGDHFPGFALDIKDETPEDIGELFFWNNTPTLPEWPLSKAGWVEAVDFYVGTYPEILIELHGKERGDDSLTARIVHPYTVFVDDFENADGTMHNRGDVHVGTAAVEISGREDPLSLGWEQALVFSSAIQEAALELRSYETN